MHDYKGAAGGVHSGRAGERNAEVWACVATSSVGNPCNGEPLRAAGGLPRVDWCLRDRAEEPWLLLLLLKQRSVGRRSLTTRRRRLHVGLRSVIRFRLAEPVPTIKYVFNFEAIDVTSAMTS